MISCLCESLYWNESEGCHVRMQALELPTSLIEENLLFERNKGNSYYRKAVWNNVADTRSRCTWAAFQLLTGLLSDCNPSALAAPLWVAELICEHSKTHTWESGICQFEYLVQGSSVSNCSALWSHTAWYSYTHVEAHCPHWDPRMVKAISNSAKPQEDHCLNYSHSRRHNPAN